MKPKLLLGILALLYMALTVKGQKISYPSTEAQRGLEKKMMSAWAAFAKDPENALEKMEWPTYDEKKVSIIQLGAPNSGNITFVDPVVIDRSCGLLSTMMSSMGGAGGLSGLTGLLGGLGKSPGGAGIPKGMGGSAPPTPPVSVPVPETETGKPSGVGKRGLGRRFYRGRRVAA